MYVFSFVRCVSDGLICVRAGMEKFFQQLSEETEEMLYEHAEKNADVHSERTPVAEKLGVE